MAKTQKNVKLPEEVLAWLNKKEGETGASHSRMILAALLCYIVQAESQFHYMRLAVRLDRGELDLEAAIRECKYQAGMLLVTNLHAAQRLAPPDKRIEAAIRKCVDEVMPLLPKRWEDELYEAGLENDPSVLAKLHPVRPRPRPGSHE